MSLTKFSDRPALYRFEALSESGFDNFITGRTGGASSAPFDSLNFSKNGGDDKADVETNMRRLAQRTGFESLFLPDQVHGDSIITLDRSFADLKHCEGDGVATNIKGFYCAVRTADCLPILLADPVSGACCAVHAGREGTELFIAVKAVRYMTENFGVRPENIIAGLGPAIRNCCYEVDRKTADNFRRVCETESVGKDLRHIDIVSANIRQIISTGVSKGSIFDSSICTSCRHDHFFSYRKDGGVTGRFISAVAGTGRL